RGARTITSEKMATTFVRETQDVERVDATGDAKFKELDRNGTANTISYTAADQMVRLRGGDPTVWDSRARTKAVEIDSNNETHVSVCRGKVQTTYYSQEQTNGARPFARSRAPSTSRVTALISITIQAARFTPARRAFGRMTITCAATRLRFIAKSSGWK